MNDIKKRKMAIHANFILLLLGMAVWKYFLYFGSPVSAGPFTSLRASATIGHFTIWSLAYYFCIQTEGKRLMWLKGNVSVIFSLFTYAIVGWIGVYVMYRTYKKQKRLAALADTPLEKMPLEERKFVLQSMFPQKTMESSPLFYAVMADDEAEVIRLSRDKRILNKTDFMNLTPLHYAAHRGNAKLVRILLDHGADPGAGEHALIAAAEGGNKETVHEFLKRGLDVNLVSPLGETLLMVAISNGHPDLASFLIERGADIHFKNGSGATALFYAARNLQIQIVQTLLEKGADANMKNAAGISPLLLAFKNDAYELSSAKGDAGPDAALDGKNVESAREQIIELLLKRGADPDISNRYRESVLSLSIEMGNDRIVALLLRHGANVNIHAEGQPSPLESALEVNNDAIVKMLLAAGATPLSRKNDKQDKIDILATGKDGSLELIMVDAGLIADSAIRLETLKKRLATYVSYADSDEFREIQRNAPNAGVWIKIVSPLPPTEEMQKIRMVRPMGNPAGAIPVIFEHLPNSPFEHKSNEKNVVPVNFIIRT